jgi:soluble lytic murein transglycosylase-like protein
MPLPPIPRRLLLSHSTLFAILLTPWFTPGASAQTSAPPAAGSAPHSAGSTPTPEAGPAAALRESLAKQRAAMEVQREAAHKQADLLRLDPLVNHTSATQSASQPVEFDCDPISDTDVTPIVETAAKANNLETGLLRAVIRQESQFYPCAVSDKGAEGLMQLMPSTSQQFGVRDAFDPKQSIEAGAKYLKQLFEKYQGKLDLVLGAYNAGPSAVDEAKGVPDIPETRNYVQSILGSLGKQP